MTAVKRRFIRKSCSGKFSRLENRASRNGPKKSNMAKQNVGIMRKSREKLDCHLINKSHPNKDIV